ncbi:uncharacterized protein K452DRAFT_358745 [Aplosporella prunicola CBS 121167]|uniref:F-box domain-containing protein n=1 Tax=Aplosporella prunicola CBS 121167 TaxID=1176127 RepID=A0A6A6BBP4_9PEZI|nr:uncharacterized protein K452DRAFT_358745 [Aplosporella prunicola CBS 121167]KAF2141619.1 hypothetical protein K452DRAFT_358745 [Aplosporella prunicola CBS 121167]
MSANLDLLPTELVEHVCNTLETTDISRLRLVCRQLSEKASRSLEHACFKSVSTSLFPESLNRVRQILQHERANQIIRSFTISVPRSFPCEEACSEHFQLVQTQGRDNLPLGILQRLPGNCRKALFSAEANKALRELFTDGSLPNCRSFTIKGTCDDETFFPTIHGSATDALLALLSHVSESRRPIEAFTLELLHDEAGALDPVRIPASCYRNPGFTEAWGGNLRELCLSFWDDRNLDPIIGLIASAVNLTKLELRTTTYTGFDKILNGIYAYNQSWEPPLRQLKLQRFKDVNPGGFLTFLLSFRETLQGISLSYMTLNSGSWHQTLFTLLHCHLHLDSIYFLLLCETYPDLNYRVRFCPVESEDLPTNVPLNLDSWRHISKNLVIGAKGLRYEGPEVAAVLRYLLSTSHVYDPHRSIKKSWTELRGSED